ncbi:protein-S-isoprenylcysteine O-methyltransferase, putative [Plasmodium malariae]|uniref:Protein-S-isoprenylcysteine O-methyltransferase n=1 Tax=Plasmodium malariae TaxID=5858 RepID=A0A1C3L395_PLAMA|nr:protein-S-isoprenylcysteine O-methyltransferase, putative [Plasmodium malariae]
MNVGMYIVSAFLLYAGVLNYKPLIYLINTNLYEIIEKKKKFEISDYWLHKWLEYGFVCVYVCIAFQPSRNVYSKRSKYNYIFAKILLIYFFFFFFHFIINISNNFPLNIFYLFLITFHLSEFFLSFVHNKNNYNYYNFLINPNYGYAYFFVLTLLEYYAKIFLFVLLRAFEKYINKYLLRQLLIFNFFFFKNYMDNYGICTYSYYNQIKTNKSNITTPIINEIQGKNKPMKKLLATRYDNNTIISLFLTKRDLLKDSNYSQIIFLRKDTNVKHVLSVYKFGRNKDSYHLYKNTHKQKKKNRYSNSSKTHYDIEEKAISSAYPSFTDLSGNKCIFNNTLVTMFIQKWTNKIFSKKYDLNNSLFQKIILKYENFFHTYDIIGNYDKIYNYYLFISILSLLFSLAGFLLRIFGLIQCSTNFSFYVLHSDTLFKKYVKRKHDLVTWGLYKYMRHPCYTGWFYYALCKFYKITKAA